MRRDDFLDQPGDTLMTVQKMRWRVNLLDDGSVITQDGEYLGTWDTDESDAIFQFTPDGSDKPIFMDPFFGLLCKQINCWHLGIPYDPDISMLAD